MSEISDQVANGGVIEGRPTEDDAKAFAASQEADQAPRVTVPARCPLCDEKVQCAVTTDYQSIPVTMTIHTLDLEAHLLGHAEQ